MNTYRIVGLGRNETVVTVKRRYRAQVQGKLAAISIPTPELRRLWHETKGNPEALLQPIREALQSSGYTDVFLLPAQTQLVQLEPKCEVGSKVPTEEEISAHYAQELVTLVRLIRAHMQDKQSTIAMDQLTSKLAELELLLWEK